MNGKLMEWKDQWNNGDVKFVPELFELVERLQCELKETNKIGWDWMERYNDKVFEILEVKDKLIYANKQIQELESEITVLKNVNNSI